MNQSKIVNYFSICRNYLKKLRQGTKFHCYVDFILEQISQGFFTLQDLGTNEEELEKLRIKALKIRAKNCVERIRNYSKNFEEYFNFLDEVLDYYFAPEDIGTTSEELGQLLIENYKIQGGRYLEFLREGFPTKYIFYIDWIKQKVREGVFTYEEIGTTSEELEKLLIENCRNECKFYIIKLAEGTEFYYNYYRAIFNLLMMLNLTLEDLDLGITKNQIFSLFIANLIKNGFRKDFFKTFSNN